MKKLKQLYRLFFAGQTFSVGRVDFNYHPQWRFQWVKRFNSSSPYLSIMVPGLFIRKYL